MYSILENRNLNGIDELRSVLYTPRLRGYFYLFFVFSNHDMRRSFKQSINHLILQQYFIVEIENVCDKICLNFFSSDALCLV